MYTSIKSYHLVAPLRLFLPNYTSHILIKMRLSKLVIAVCIIVRVDSYPSVEAAIKNLVATGIIGTGYLSYVTHMESISGLVRQTIAQPTDTAKVKFYAKTRDRLELAGRAVGSAYTKLPHLNVPRPDVPLVSSYNTHTCIAYLIVFFLGRGTVWSFCRSYSGK